MVRGEVVGVKTRPTLLLTLLLAGGLQALIASGCANTARGIRHDYQNNEDRVEHAMK